MFPPKVNIFSHHARCLPARAYPRKNHGSSIYSFLVRITPSLPPPHPSGAAPPCLPPPSSSRAVPTGGSGGGRPGASEPPPDLGAAGLGRRRRTLGREGEEEEEEAAGRCTSVPREEPVASGVLHVRDLSFLRPLKGDGEADGMTEEQEEEKYFEWRSSLVEKLEGIELNLEGVKFRMTVEIPPSDDFKVMKKSWEDFYSSELLNSSMNWFLYCIFLVFPARWSWD